MEEHHFTVLRTARYHSIGEPNDRLRQVGFVCHGHRQLAGRFLRQFEALAGPHRMIVAPEALSRFYVNDSGGTHGPDAAVGATWMTREERLHEINDYVLYLDALYSRVLGSCDRSAVRVFVLGFSQGAATAARWLTSGLAMVEHLILWGSFLPPDLNMKAFAAKIAHRKLSVVVGEHDEFATPELIADSEKRLTNHGIEYELVRFDGGHHIDVETLRDVLGDV